MNWSLSKIKGQDDSFSDVTQPLHLWQPQGRCNGPMDRTAMVGQMEIKHESDGMGSLSLRLM